MKVLFLGDVVGPLGRKAVKKYLGTYKEKLGIDFVIANGENATHGHGLSVEHYKELKNSGVDCVTNGNHFFNCKEPFSSPESYTDSIRPYNLDKDVPLSGTKVFVTSNGIKIRVTNLLGRVFIPMTQTNPFYDLDTIIKEDKEKIIHIVDFHAEATAEKRCLAEYADGRITALIGTHTHVQTNDPKLLNKGTFFLTDSGMNGAYDSVLGDEKDGSIKRTLSGMPANLVVPRAGKMQANGVIMDIDEKTTRVVSFSLVNQTMEDDR